MEKRKRKPKVALSPNQENRYIKLVLALIVFAFLWVMFAPNTGFLSLLRQRSELKALQQETQGLVKENEELRKEVDRIKNDDAYLEEISRRDYNMVKENEILFDFNPDDEKKKKNDKK